MIRGTTKLETREERETWLDDAMADIRLDYLPEEEAEYFRELRQRDAESCGE